MKITINSKNFNPSDKLVATIESKFSKLDKYFSKDVQATIMCSEVKTGLCKLEATIRAAGMLFRAEESSNDIYFNLDKVIDKLASQMSRFKTKLLKKHKNQTELLLDEIPETASQDQGVVKVKHFELTPMSQEEAILQMEMLAHTFFVYRDGETGFTNVVYKRADGSYGVLETE